MKKEISEERKIQKLSLKRIKWEANLAYPLAFEVILFVTLRFHVSESQVGKSYFGHQLQSLSVQKSKINVWYAFTSSEEYLVRAVKIWMKLPFIFTGLL